MTDNGLSLYCRYIVFRVKHTVCFQLFLAKMPPCDTDADHWKLSIDYIMCSALMY